MISMFPELFSLYGEKIGEYPWWITLWNVVIHFLAIKQCIKMDNGDVRSPLKKSHNTVHTFFWLAVLLMLPGVGVILFFIFSYSFYIGWEMEKERKDNFNLNCKLFLGYEDKWKASFLYSFYIRVFRSQFIAKKYLYSGLDNSKLTEYDYNASGKKEYKYIQYGGFISLFLIFIFLVIVSLFSYIDTVEENGDSFNYVPFLTAFCFYVIVVVQDWYCNYCGKKMFFRIVWLNGTQPLNVAEPILDKYHLVEYDYCNIFDNDKAVEITGNENIQVVSPTVLTETMNSLTPEFFNTYSMFTAVSNCLLAEDCSKLKGMNDFAVEFLDPTYSYDLLDVKKAENISSTSNITRYVYLDWYHAYSNVYVNWDNKEQYENYSENEDIRCLERTIYSISPKFRNLFNRAAVYFLIIWMLFSPMSYSWHTGLINFYDKMLSKFF